MNILELLLEKLFLFKPFHSFMGGGGGGTYTDPRINEYSDASYKATMNRAGASGPVSGAGMYDYGGTGNSSSQSPYSLGYQNSTYPGYTANQTQGGAYRMSSMGNPSNSNRNSSLAGSIAGLKPGQSSQSKSQYNLGNVGAPLGGPQGIKTATAGYDMSPMDEATAGYRKGYASNSPFKFNFGSLPDEYTKMAYQSGASDINRAGSDQLKQLRESVGTRRPGLLFSAGQQSQRDTGKNLAKLNTDLQLNRMNQNLQLGKEQQMAQAGENRDSATTGMNWLQGLYGAGQNKIGTQSGLVQNERAYQDQAIQNIMDLYRAATGQANQAAQVKNQQQQAAMANLMGIANLGMDLI